MKRFCLLLVCLLILPIFFVGCDKDDENDFIEVQSITYSIGDETTTLSSTFKTHYTNPISMSYEEFNTSNEEIIIDYAPSTNNQIINCDKSNLNKYKSYLYKTCFYSYTPYPDTPTDSANHYYKFKFEKIEEFYVSVKVISDNVLEIKSSQSEISRICTTSYKINYFI